MKWDKQRVFDQLHQALERDRQQAVKASKDAAEYAVDGEAKAESKWDTQGIEASYLAAGQARHAQELIEAIKQLLQSSDKLTRPTCFVGIGSLFCLESNNEMDYYFISPVGGGMTLTIDDCPLTIISPQSPIAKQLAGKTTNATLKLPNNSLALLKELY